VQLSFFISIQNTFVVEDRLRLELSHLLNRVLLKLTVSENVLNLQVEPYVVDLERVNFVNIFSLE